MHRGTTSEVNCLELISDPATLLRGRTIERENPMRNREVHDRDPQTRKQQPRPELQPVSHRTRNQRHRDDREHQLKRHKHCRRNRAHQRNIDNLGRLDPISRIGNHRLGSITTDKTLQTEKLRRVTKQPRNIVTERQRVPIQHPQHRHQTHRTDTHHDHVQHVLRADHAAIEKSQAGRHQQHQRGTGQHPRSVTGIRDTHSRETIH